MADDSPGTLTLLDGGGVPRTFNVSISGGTLYSFQQTPRVNGAEVGTTNPIPTKAGQTSLVTLDVAVVTTANTAVTALAAGHCTAGGYIVNGSATTIMTVNQIGTASGAVSSGNNIAIQPLGDIVLLPSPNAVSVVSTLAGHVFGGYGQQ